MNRIYTVESLANLYVSQVDVIHSAIESTRELDQHNITLDQCK